jgi:hypothetical protein
VLPKDHKAFEPCHGVLILHVLSGETMIDRRFPCRTMSVGSQRDRKYVGSFEGNQTHLRISGLCIPRHCGEPGVCTPDLGFPCISECLLTDMRLSTSIQYPPHAMCAAGLPAWCVKNSVNATSLLIPAPFFLLFHSSRSRFTHPNTAFGCAIYGSIIGKINNDLCPPGGW